MFSFIIQLTGKTYIAAAASHSSPLCLTDTDSIWFWTDLNKIETLAIIPQLCVTAVPSLKESRWAEAAASISVVWTMSILAVILRLIARKMSNAKYGMDDILIVVGLVSNNPTGDAIS